MGKGDVKVVYATPTQSVNGTLPSSSVVESHQCYHQESGRNARVPEHPGRAVMMWRRYE